MQRALNSFTVSVYSFTCNIWNICGNVDTQEALSQAFGCLKALTWAFSLNEVFFTCLVEIRGTVKERKAGRWSHRKGQSESERTKEQAQLETERLRDWNANIVRRKRGRLTTKNTYHLFEYWIAYSVAFSFSCVLLTFPMNS